MNTKSTKDIPKRFNSSTTALKILNGLDLSGKIALITGASNGIGFEAAKTLVFHGCFVIFACRSQEATEKAISLIEAEKNDSVKNCKFIKIDLASFKSVDNFVETIKNDYNHIDYLILNAGLFCIPYALTEDGYETTFQVNHLSHFYIATTLLNLLDSHSRIIVVSSSGHALANLPIEGLTQEILSPPENKYWRIKAYNISKLCNLVFTRELAKRLEDKKISCFSLHPGNGIPTGYARPWFVSKILRAAMKPFSKSLQQGAATTIYCAVAEELNGYSGQYFEDCYVSKPSKLAENDKFAKKVWEITEGILENLKK